MVNEQEGISEIYSYRYNGPVARLCRTHSFRFILPRPAIACNRETSKTSIID
ncbi:Hypothetical protein FKW44_012937 [Caligus rogercresseyi]|uniref:Uncharacterized protein n=1 Tax=Caligus rogercresseyi TaxID=217165 RepID=A0A7T8K9W5_CALRO|nr:Hypothetical protein FKW44_012937 [Caligus rogercresseyi]